MNAGLRVFFVVFVFLAAVPQVLAEEWRGIVPLRSTRADVVRLFGECAGSESSCEFMLPNEEILIEFATPACSYAVAPDTVLMVQRELQTGTTLEALGLDRRRLKSFNPAASRYKGYQGYFDEKSGLLLKSFRGEIFQIIYIPTEKERLVCPSFYSRPKDFVAVFFEHMGVVAVECPETATIGEKLVCSASYARTGARNTLTWLTTGGRIVQGQHTKKILLDTSGFQGTSIVVTVERNDGYYHVGAASCTVKLKRDQN